MPHPGYDFRRNSYSVLSKTACWFSAYLSQILQIEKDYDKGGMGKSGALFKGTVFHTLMEVHLMPDKYKGKPMSGTDGKPVLNTKQEAVEYFLNQGFAPDSVEAGIRAFDTYIEKWGERDPEIKSRLIGKPESDIAGDLKYLHESLDSFDFIPYTAQYDAIVRLDDKSVASVEHKSALRLDQNTLAYYRHSGQLIGQCALWNARTDLVSKYGKMNTVILNLAFTGGKQEPHRESIYIPPIVQINYARALGDLHKELAKKLDRYAKNPAKAESIFPKNGMTHNQCFGIGYTCPFISGCHENCLSSDEFKITDEGRTRLDRDKTIKLL
jgi:hypothetical protein